VPSSTLSTGTKIGIGAGIGGGFLLLLVIWAVYWLGRSQGRAYNSKSNTAGYTGPPLQDMQRAAVGWPPGAKFPPQVHELHTRAAVVAELPETS
jgi:hypothetical protein